ncbi:MAG TPA: contractile injection system tape measure protein, partial [Prolixibacteraceae bacterium]|nr:contractile injection system tape measure protein [Prolixibacteraceae bacterium]
MKQPEQHSINKVFLEVNTTRQETAFTIRENINTFLENDLLPELESIFDNFDVMDSIILLAQLKVEIGIDKWGNAAQLKTGIANRLQNKLQLAIKGLPQNGSVVLDQYKGSKMVTFNANAEAVFLWFLEHGRLPWFGNQDHIQEISEP